MRSFAKQLELYNAAWRRWLQHNRRHRIITRHWHTLPKSIARSEEVGQARSVSHEDPCIGASGRTCITLSAHSRGRFAPATQKLSIDGRRGMRTIQSRSRDTDAIVAFYRGPPHVFVWRDAAAGAPSREGFSACDRPAAPQSGNDGQSAHREQILASPEVAGAPVDTRPLTQLGGRPHLADAEDHMGRDGDDATAHAQRQSTAAASRQSAAAGAAQGNWSVGHVGDVGSQARARCLETDPKKVRAAHALRRKRSPPSASLIMFRWGKDDTAHSTMSKVPLDVNPQGECRPKSCTTCTLRLTLPFCCAQPPRK